MKSRFTGRNILILSVPILAAILAGVSWWARHATSYRTLRKPPPEGPIGRILDPGSAMDQLRRAREASSGGSPQAAGDLRRAREDLARLEASAVPTIRRTLYSSSEAAGLKLDLADILSEMKAPEARALLASLFADASQEERLRTLALMKLSSRPSDEDFTILRKAYFDEPAYGGRHLLVRAIGRSRDPESTALLLDSAANDSNPSARLQALESLGDRIDKPGVLPAVREVLKGKGSQNARLAALRAMSGSRDASVEPALKQIAESPDEPEVLRQAAANAIAQRLPK